MKFVCKSCDREYTSTDMVWRCECGGYIVCEYPVTFNKSDIRQDRFSMWRYDKAFPVKYEELTATYEEGLTPLVDVKYCGKKIKVKMDNLMPTGSFKDRGVVMIVNFLNKLGITKIVEDSSGNAGASTAGYCALAGIDCDIYVPKSTSEGKLVQTKCYNANIYPIEGTREAVAEAAQSTSGNSFYAGHNWHPLFIQGTKSMAYEIWEQNGFKAPKNIVASMGGGSTVLGLYYGFKELLISGEIERMPRIYGAQAENCNPIYRKFKGMGTQFEASKTHAEGIALYTPNKIDELIDAISDVNGDVLSIKEDEIVDALKKISSEGFYIEPTSSVAFAAVEKLISNNTIKDNEDVIVIISGNGLKATDKIQALM